MGDTLDRDRPPGEIDPQVVALEAQAPGVEEELELHDVAGHGGDVRGARGGVSQPHQCRLRGIGAQQKNHQPDQEPPMPHRRVLREPIV